MPRVSLALAVSLAVSVMGLACSSSGDGAPAPTAPQDETAEPTASPKKQNPPDEPAAPATSAVAPSAPADDAGSHADSAAACKDTNPEPGANEADALSLGATDDCDKNVRTVRGVSNGMFDVDTYKFQGNDTYLCRMGPKATNKTPGVRMCLFVQCLAGRTNVSACNKGVAANSKSALPGCCVDGPGEVDLAFDCNSSIDDSANFFLRVDQPGGNACVPYETSYSL